MVRISVEPETVYFEEARGSLNLNFDFVIKGLSEKKLQIRFIKAAVYDSDKNLIGFRHLNHNAVGTASIHTIGRYEIDGKESLDVFNPFYSFPHGYPVDHLRYMFTFYEREAEREFYYGNVVVKPVCYEQEARLHLPLKGLLTVLDGHDFYSHHRRFAMSIVRNATNGRFQSNFSRYGLDFTVVGEGGNTRALTPDEAKTNYDFHFDDVSKFYTHGAVVYAPADGEIVGVVDSLDDLYDTTFDMEDSIERDTVEEIAGNYIVIKHNKREFSHLFHLMKGSAQVGLGDQVITDQAIAKVGFSGAATTYSHLHYQLLDGKDFLRANPVPCKFSDVTLVLGSHYRQFEELTIDTGDFVMSDF